MGSLADISLGDIFRALARYRPVAVTVGLILLVLALLPAPAKAPLSALPSVPPAAAAADVPASPATDAAPVDEAAADASTFDSSSNFASSSPSSNFSPSTPANPSSDFSSSDSSSNFSSTDFSSPSSDFGSSDSSSPSTTEAMRPLAIVGSGWSSSTGATPLGSTDVPAGKLPVGKRIGQIDKYSFVRLSGEEKVLLLKETSAGARSTTGAIGVSACQILAAGWPEQENVPSDRAPKYDSATCVAGERGADGRWSFNLVTFASPTDARGIALVPTGASVDYQVNFEKS